MKNLKKLIRNKRKVYVNNKSFINRFQKEQLNLSKFKHNMLTNKIFYMENFTCYQDLAYNLNFSNNFYTAYPFDMLEDTFSLSKHHTFESYLTAIELIDYSYLNGRFILKSKYSMLTYFIPFLIKNGNRLNSINNTLKSISNIYNTLSYSNIDDLSSYFFINQFKHYIDTTNDIYNINFLLHWIINIYKPVFDIKCFNVPKMYSKNSDKSVLFKIMYISEKSRLKVAYKHIAVCIKKNESNKLNNRITNILLDTLLNYKDSYLYNRKMYIYEQAMEL